MNDQERYLFTAKLSSIDELNILIDAIDKINNDAHKQWLEDGDHGCGESFESLMESLKQAG